MTREKWGGWTGFGLKPRGVYAARVLLVCQATSALLMLHWNRTELAALFVLQVVLNLFIAFPRCRFVKPDDQKARRFT